MSEVILLLLLVIVLLYLTGRKISAQKDLLESLNKKINYLNDQVSQLSTQIKNTVTPGKPVVIIPETKPVPETKPIPETKPVPEPLTEKPAPVIIEPVPPPVFTKKPAEPVYIPPVTHRQPEPVSTSASTRWMNNNPDLEKFIGENLANKIGIAILVLGISFFVKYAIDKDWINESGRVLIGMACGALLIGVAHYFRNNYRSFSSVLAGGGIAVFYFTIAYAFHQYHLIGQSTSFVIMVLITALAVFLSISYNRLELAIIAVIGGFVTPFLVSTGQDNYTALFTYMCILNTGLLVLAYFKRWPSINSIALFFTILIFGGWLAARLYDSNKLFPFQAALLFASLFYIQFLAMNVVNNIKLKKSFSGGDFIGLFSINFFYFTAGMSILQHWDGGAYQGLFTVILGLINLALLQVFYRRNQVDRNFLLLLTGMTISFISIAAPVQLKGNYITLFWAAEMVTLFWLYQRSQLKLLKLAAFILSLLMIGSLLMDWSQIYDPPITIIPILINKGFITSVVSATALLLFYRFMLREADSFYVKGITNKAIRRFLLVAGLIIAFLSGALEIRYQFDSRFPEIPLAAVYLQLYIAAFSLTLLYIFRNKSGLVSLRIFLPFFSFLFYFLHLHANDELLQTMLSTNNYKGHFIAHWIGVGLLFILLFRLVTYFLKNMSSHLQTVTWLATAAMIILLSVEGHHLLIWVNYQSVENTIYLENLYYKAGLSILWGSCSFVMMWLGMKYKFGTLRIISLTLFLVTIIKLFGYDILNMPPGGKIAAFILLGVLLLTISFMYQRLKKMIIDDGTEKK